LEKTFSRRRNKKRLLRRRDSTQWRDLFYNLEGPSSPVKRLAKEKGGKRKPKVILPWMITLLFKRYSVIRKKVLREESWGEPFPPSLEGNFSFFL